VDTLDEGMGELQLKMESKIENESDIHVIRKVCGKGNDGTYFKNVSEAINSLQLVCEYGTGAYFGKKCEFYRL